MSRVKQVYPYDELASVWLSQSQDTGRSPGERMYFSGDTIYSYGSHFPIARLFDSPNGEPVILFTTRSYSNTTSKHVRVVQQAVRSSSRRVVYCMYPQAADNAAQHEVNLADFKQHMDAAAVKHAKARKPELYAGDIKNEARLAREYCEVMCLPVPTWAMLPNGIEAGKPMIAALRAHAEEVSHV